MKKTVSFLSVVLLLFSGCSNVSEEDLLEPILIIPGDTINYIEDIKPIIENNCTLCHNNPPVNGAPMSLKTYIDVRAAIENRGLIDRISRQAGEPGAMPFNGPRLPQNLIDLIIAWEAGGFIEN